MQNNSNNPNRSRYSDLFTTNYLRQGADINSSALMERANQRFRKDKTYREKYQDMYQFSLVFGYVMQAVVLVLSLAFLYELFYEHLPQILSDFKFIVALLMAAAILVVIEYGKRWCWSEYFESIILAKAQENATKVAYPLAFLGILLLVLSSALTYEGAKWFTEKNLDQSTKIVATSDTASYRVQQEYKQKIDKVDAQIEPLQKKMGERTWGLTEAENQSLLFLQSEKLRLQKQMEKELNKIFDSKQTALKDNSKTVNHKGGYLVFIAIACEFIAILLIRYTIIYLAKVHAESELSKSHTSTSTAPTVEVTVEKFDFQSKMYELIFDVVSKNVKQKPTHLALPTPTNEVKKLGEDTQVGFRPPTKQDDSSALPKAEIITNNEKHTHTIIEKERVILPKKEEYTSAEILEKNPDIVAYIHKLIKQKKPIRYRTIAKEMNLEDVQGRLVKKVYEAMKIEGKI